MSDEAIAELKGRVPSVECLVPRGGVIAMRPLIVHSSSKTTTEAARRVIHIEYTAAAVVDDGMELDVPQRADVADEARLLRRPVEDSQCSVDIEGALEMRIRRAGQESGA